MNDPRGPAPAPPHSRAVPEWERLRRFLHADAPPLALIEVESRAQGEQVIETVEREAGGRVLVYRFGPDSTPRDALDWLDAARGQADGRTVLLLVAADLPAEAEWHAPAFWREMSFQRERWRAPAGRLAFVLTPSLVDRLARDADALWDWIPLKFNLVRPTRLGSFGQDQRSRLPADRPGRTPAEAIRLLPALREQLVNARRKGLGESVIRREYAWPLFRGLLYAGRLREAAALLATDLSGDFASELPPRDRIDWLVDLGYLRLDQWDIPAAESAFREVVGLAEQAQDEAGWAAAYFGLGRVAQERRDLSEAEKWYGKSLAICEEQGNRHGAGTTYHQLGVVAQMRRDLTEAKRWYLKSLAVKEQQGDEHGAAGTYHQLGMVAEDRRDLAEAQKWYLKSLEIEERQGNEHGAAMTYGQLGNVALARQDLPAAKKWYVKSLVIREQLGHEHGAASAHYQLGKVALVAGGLDEAEKRHLKAIELFGKVGDEHHAAVTCGGLGVVARERGDMLESGRWLVRAVRTLLKTSDPQAAQICKASFAETYKQGKSGEREELERMWREAGLGDLPAADD